MFKDKINLKKLLKLAGHLVVIAALVFAVNSDPSALYPCRSSSSPQIQELR